MLGPYNIYRKPVQIIGFLLMMLNLHGQRCDDLWLIEAKDSLESCVLSYRPISGLKFADSVSLKIKSLRLDKCESAYWIEYYRAELLELNSKFKDALDIYYGQLTYARENEKWELLTCVHIAVSRVMETIGRGGDCLRHLNFARNYLEKYQLLDLYAFYCVRNSSYHRIYNNKDSANYYAREALSYAIKHYDARQIADANLLLGLLSVNTDTALYYSRQAQHQFIGNRNYIWAANMARKIYLTDTNGTQTIHSDSLLDSIWIYLNQVEDRNFLYHIFANFYHEEKAKKFYSENIFDSAYIYLMNSKEHFNKSIFDVDQPDVTQAEIDFIKSSESIKADSLARQSKLQKILLFILIIGLLSILAVVYYIVLKSRKIEKQRVQIQIQNDELAHSFQKQSILLSEIHHRVKNNLQLVISLLTLHFNKVKDNSEYQYLEEISNKVRSIALIHEHLYNTGEFERIELKSYLRDLLEHYLALHTSDAQFDYILESDPDIFLNLETVMPIGIICTELISNSLKYAKHGAEKLLLDFRLQKLDSKFILKFQDNGKVGMDKAGAKYKSGMGTMLIESMVRQLQAQSSPILNGTSTFNLIFQEKKLSSL
ncbi:MAG: sensor histidine kinase [Saprospiraceae bacterium]|nr:sensor histidine kinase [Candidatus Vicinibacter affinis]